jgi:molecular chaperone DnaK
MIILGLDIGTTRSKAAFVDETGRPQIVLNRRGEPYTPSAVFFEDGRHPIVGTEAVAEGILQPAHVHTCFKRILGCQDELYTDANGKRYAAVDLQSILIGHLREDVEARFHAKVDEAVIAVPANFKDDQKQATIDAARAAGLEVLRLVHEPTAAGLAYALGKHQDQRFVVYDLGGGTFDVSVIETSGHQINVLTSTGCERLGGEDFNERLESRLIERFAKDHGFKPTAESDPIVVQEIREKVEQAKISLSEKTKTKIVIGCRGKQSIIEIARADFEQWTADLRRQTLECTSKAVQQSGLDWKDVHSIILVGGAVRMPAIQSELADLTGIVPHCDIEPDRAVAYGAALQCAVELTSSGRTLMVGGRVIPSPKAFVQEVTSHSVGCCVAEHNGHLANAVILPKGTPVPSAKTDRFALQFENQNEARIEVLQGEEGQERDGCLAIGEIVLSNLPPEAKRSKRIEIVYSIDKNGMIRATGRDLVGGQSVEIKIDYRTAIASTPRKAATAGVPCDT